MLQGNRGGSEPDQTSVSCAIAEIEGAAINVGVNQSNALVSSNPDTSGIAEPHCVGENRGAFG